MKALLAGRRRGSTRDANMVVIQMGRKGCWGGWRSADKREAEAMGVSNGNCHL